MYGNACMNQISLAFAVIEISCDPSTVLFTMDKRKSDMQSISNKKKQKVISLEMKVCNTKP